MVTWPVCSLASNGPLMCWGFVIYAKLSLINEPCSSLDSSIIDNELNISVIYMYICYRFHKAGSDSAK